MSNRISIRKRGHAGLITITRPNVLNAITFEMCMAIKSAREAWRDDPKVALILIEGEGDKAFSAGGDIEEIYRAGLEGDVDFSRNLWRNEYPFLAEIEEYPKPCVALMDGYVMGLGAGVSMHGSHRVVTERTAFAMPECTIGHIPDTGVSARFALAPGSCGKYLGMTGTRLGPADTIHAGLADCFVRADKIAELREALVASGDVGVIEELSSEPPDGELRQRQAQIDEHFSKSSALEIIRGLEREDDDWAKACAKSIRRASPLSIACFHGVMERVSENPSVRNAVTWEFRYGYRSLSNGDFMEGVRAQIIDKDRQPSWRFATLEALSPAEVEAMLAPLGPAELYG
ncbi:MAG: 3-hydroxyisobutyryl-CoA hydrolase [Deltaproteobacteria bacterium]